MKHLVVLISGNGSNLQSIIDAIESNRINANITRVISNKKTAYGLERARKHNIAWSCIEHSQYESRAEYDEALLKVIEPSKTDLVVLAGFMRILTPRFIDSLDGKILNIHPSLLPKYKGLNTHQRALDNGDQYHGASVHFVTAELDGGPVVLQKSVLIEPGDTPEILAQRVQVQERIIYPKVVRWFCEDKLKMKDNLAYFENELIDTSGIREECVK